METSKHCSRNQYARRISRWTKNFSSVSLSWLLDWTPSTIFFVNKVDIRLVGYHHDLAPKNILVNGNKLLLADFGLSNFKVTIEKSSTSFKHNRGFYIAPECQDLEGKLQTHCIRQESDIWSFGCILMVVFVYMKRGTKGVQEFEDARIYTTAECIWRRFHEGPDRPSPAVQRWLEQLSNNASRCEKRLLHLISEMLSIGPWDRPKSRKVLRLLQLVAIDAFSSAMEEIFVRKNEEHSDIEAFIECKRFRSWTWAFEQMAGPQFRNSGEENNDVEPLILVFDEVIKLLQNIKDLIAVGGRLEGQRDQWGDLRSLNNSLFNILPYGFRGQARDHLEAELLQTNDASLLEATKTAMQSPNGDEMIGVLAAVKSMTIRAEKSLLTKDPGRRIQLRDIATEEEIGHHRLATLHTPSGTARKVLVEWLEYDAKSSVKDIGEKLFTRIESITEILSSPELSKIPAVLRSCGFFHDPAQHAFGQVYDLPSWYGEENKAISLRNILSKNPVVCCPALEDRLKLARTLTSSILVFHKIPWLHRALNASNIIFFPSNGSPPAEWIRHAYIVGFMHSRANEKNPFTQGPQDGKEFQNYQHPDYLRKGGVLYKPEFDYYSLGILLLEIGLWDSLSSIVASKSFRGLSNQEFRQRLLESRIPRLWQTMGSIYMNATRVCLDGTFPPSQPMTSDNSSTIFDTFKSLVVDQIGDCRV